MRHKLRLLELERDKACAKQPELNDLRNSLRALETKRREEVNDRDRKMMELEKKLQAEKKRRELLESKNQDNRHLFEEENRKLRSILCEKAILLKGTQDESRIVKEKCGQLENRNAVRTDELLQQLDQYRSLLEAIVRQYGILASRSASLAEYNHLKDENLVLQCGQYRLERRLANSESQVLELARLIHEFKEQNADLSQQLHDALAEVNHLSHSVASRIQVIPNQDDLQSQLLNIENELTEERQQLSDSMRNTDTFLLTYYHFLSNHLFVISTDLAEEHSEALTLAERRKADLSSALTSHASDLESMQKDRLIDQEALHAAKAEIDKLRSSGAVFEARLLDARQQIEDSNSIHDAVLEKERKVVQRLTTTIQKSRMAEEGLRADIDR